MVDEDGIYRIYKQSTIEFDPDKEVEVIDPESVPVSDPFGLTHKFKVKLDKKGNPIKAKSLIEGKNIKSAKYYGPNHAYTIGTADRRKVKSLWQDEFLRTAVLLSCVWSTEWNVTGNELSLMVHQRSCDVPLGLPFNVTQYAAY